MKAAGTWTTQCELKVCSIKSVKKKDKRHGRHHGRHNMEETLVEINEPSSVDAAADHHREQAGVGCPPLAEDSTKQELNNLNMWYLGCDLYFLNIPPAYIS